MFILPEELFCSPFNLWELHQGLRENPDMYKEFHPIINTPAEPTATWKPKQRAPQVEANNDWPGSQHNDFFIFRMVKCPLHMETLCFWEKAPYQKRWIWLETTQVCRMRNLSCILNNPSHRKNRYSLGARTCKARTC